AIQHNEAVNLACEHIGIQRTRTDAYFDGTLGKSLVKIIPFGHPLTPLDLEELKRELDARPDEDRPITLVCLGMELAAKAWIEDWNRLRKGKDAVNRITVIELRTDPKYGKFIKHEPARARVTIVRKDDKLVIEIEDFIAPTIIERLQQQAGLLQPKIDDWRAMVDCVMIDPDYDGHVFKVALSDIPERKSDFVSGRYELPAPSDKTTVAVKVIDMLGEEVLVSQIV
ncbi:MAG: restriction endonuclease subunit M, partial [Nitrospiraceae bacterium]